MPKEPTTHDKPRNARLEARLPGKQQDFFQRAAALPGHSLSEFFVEGTQKAAIRIVQEHEVIRLSRAEQVAFVSALLSPAKPGVRLQKAVRAYRRKTGL